MTNFYQCSDGTLVNCDLVTVVSNSKECSKEVLFHFGFEDFIQIETGSEEEARQEITNFLAHCEGEFRE